MSNVPIEQMRCASRTGIKLACYFGETSYKQGYYRISPQVRDSNTGMGSACFSSALQYKINHNLAIIFQSGATVVIDQPLIKSMFFIVLREPQLRNQNISLF
ncbi:hypothetical protein PoB_005645000 [Plakobranchus ocellatus]|uniref:Uncharacterized protein n=1 Tax=Plakobranchus ocellatus TaxID=259542 RepID=A0AAV4CE25_9GAST|nr:hypothetical protein PoB_005645000 [Plakobranchus ocellatus]